MSGVFQYDFAQLQLLQQQLLLQQQQQQQQHAAQNGLPTDTLEGATGDAKRTRRHRDAQLDENAFLQLLNEDVHDADVGNDNGNDINVQLYQDTNSSISFDAKHGPVGIPHPDPTVETASLGAVVLPTARYKIALPRQIIDEGKLSLLQLTSAVYASQRFDTFLASGERCGFFLGDGAGIGKGRQIAGLARTRTPNS